MPRRPREHGARTLYHVAVSATARGDMYEDDEDRECFVRILDYTVRKYGWELRAYVMMTTHAHLLVFTPDDNISRGMQLLSGFYAQLFNKRHDRPGHFVRGRFSSTVVRRPGHALEVCRYIALNPVRAGICSRPEAWRWSSYRAAIGIVPPPDFLDVSWVRGIFHTDWYEGARMFRRFVEAALPDGVRPRNA